MVLDSHVLAFHDADFAEAFAERGYIARTGIGGPVSDKRDHRHCGLLRPRRERPPGRCAAEKRDEVAPGAHSTTSSAMASSVCGTSRPSAFAALRLIANSNLVGCTTGRSAGRAPLSTLPT